MISDSLHNTVKGVDKEVERHDNCNSRHLLAVSRLILTRQSTVFDHAMHFGAELVPFNSSRVAWAQKTKASLAKLRRADSP